MNIRDLKYLVAVADVGHFGQAAERCYVSQPTLSTQLKKLEDELGVVIFERNNKRVRVTAAGKAVVAQARQVLLAVERLQAIAQETQDPNAGTFHLGIIPTLGPYLLPHFLQRVKKQFPKLQLVVCENKTEVIVQQLKRGDLDAVIVALPLAQTDLIVHELFHEPFYLALPRQHSLSAKQHLTLQDVEHETLLLLEEGHCLREQALEACALSSAQEQMGFKATSLETLRHIVASGAGITLLPALSVPVAVRDPAIVVKPFAPPVPARKVGMLWRKTTSRTQCCKGIAQIVSQAVHRNSYINMQAALKMLTHAIAA